MCRHKPILFCHLCRKKFIYIVSWINEDNLSKKSSLVGKSVSLAREKIKMQMKQYLCA